MSQHDLNIANQGFPAFRADLNDALVALGSTNSGATAPATTFANQLWYDTANNILKIRNEDNDAWISLLTLNQSLDTLDNVFGLVIGTNVLAYDANLQSFVTAFTLPTTDGSNGQVLQTNGSGTLSFATVGGDKISAGNSFVQVVDTGTGYALVNIDGTEVARFTPARLGINIDNPSQNLHVYSSSTATAALQDPNGVLRLLTTGGVNYIQSGSSFSNSSNALVFGGINAVTEYGRFEGNGDFKFNSGYGSSATAYGCRAWIRLNMATASITGSGNVSSVTDNGTGNFTVNFSTAMPNSDYAAVSGSTDNITNGSDMVNAYPDGTGSFRLIGMYVADTTNRDVARASGAVFR